jgi:hypothetical protein
LKNITILDKCRVCGLTNFEIVLILKDTPLEDQFLKERIKQPSFPLEVAMCKGCCYVFLLHEVSPDISYEEYIYESSITIGLEDHYDQYAKELVSENNIRINSLAIDIGSNDGSMLKAFERQKLKALGIEPAKNISNFANQKKLRTINSFFNLELANKIVSSEGKASLITANYMFANVDNLHDFILGIKVLLEEDGIFCIQTGYHPLQFLKNMFDYIYHEHFSYFTLYSLSVLFKKFDMEIVNATTVKPKGGSIRLVIKNIIKNQKKTESLKNLILNEKQNNYNSNEIFFLLNKNIKKEKQKLITQLNHFKKQNIKIAAIGASHSTTTLIYYFELYDYFEFIIDDNPKKHNTYSPGLHIKVLDNTHVKKENINCLVVLAWQHQEVIIKKYTNFIKNNGLLIIPLPKFKIIKKI